jgi:hypothetical protein
MRSAITVNYVPDGEDWTITVSYNEETRTARATGLISARDRADQLVEQLEPDPTARTVVHLLEGDGVAFTDSYLHARLGLSDPAPEPTIPEPATGEAAPDADPAPVAPVAPVAAAEPTHIGTLPMEQPSAS